MESKMKVKKGPNFFIKGIIVVLFVIVVGIIINVAPNYIDTQIKDKINLIVNNNNVTLSLKKDIYVDENEVIYLSKEDIENFFDGNIYYDEKYNQIVTGSNTKLAALPIDKKEIEVNSSKVRILGAVTKNEENYYIPFSELAKIYNVEVKYIRKNNVVVIESLEREKKMANISKNCQIKSLPTIFSRSVENVEQGNNVVIVPTNEELDGWVKVRTESGKLGYTKEIANTYIVRETMKEEKQIQGKISLVWDYYSEYASAPTRTEPIAGINVVSPSFAILKDEGKGELVTNIGEKGRAYVEWAHSNGYKVWPMISNNSYIQTTSDILNDYKLREKLINNIMEIVSEYKLDGINIDFENMYEKDKKMFSRFIIELAPRLKEYGKVLTVDVTAPDGSATWSLCYDRNLIGKVADYVAFMAYDQYGTSSKKAGTTGGCDWVEVNINKFIGTQEEVPAEKLILGMPLYTRLWWNTADGSEESTAISMKNVNKYIPNGVQKQWDDNLKQNYVQYDKDGRTYKMWIEDEQSAMARFELMKKYNLAGAAYWQKGYEYDGYWDFVNTLINE